MDFVFSAEDEAFRGEVRAWLAEHLTGAFQALGAGSDMGGPAELGVRKGWERELATGGWIGLSWPAEYGGRDASLTAQMIFNEEYTRAGGPLRCGFFGEQLLGPTIMAFGSPEQKARFLPPILRGEELWCQGFSEPGAGSDLAGIATRAVRDGDTWRIDGQKVWTSLGHIADWIFVACRTDPGAGRHKGLTFLLCPMDQPGVEVRPIRQLTGTAEFNEVFFDDARTPADMVVGEVGAGWGIVMATLGFERGTAFLAQQVRFAAEYDALILTARKLGRSHDPVLRQKLAASYVGLELMRLTGLRTVSDLLAGRALGPSASVGKLLWSRWHQQLGELAMDIYGPAATQAEGPGSPPGLGEAQYTFGFSRAHTIYAGSSEIQRNIIGERILGLAKDPT